jgi:hypothetical protein
MQNVTTGHHRLKLRFVWLLTGLLAASPLPAAQDVTHDDYQPSTERGGGDGGGGNDWTAPAIVAGAAAILLVGRWLQDHRQAAQQPAADEGDMLARLRQQGPEFALRYNTSAFAAIGMVQGGWPFVLDFTHERPVLVTLRIRARDVPEIYTLRLPFGANETGRHSVQFRLPPAFGASERPAAIAVIATDMSGEHTEPSFRIHALGCGPRAVGSVAIEEVSFLPRLIRAEAREQASYRFFSHSDFPSAVAEFIRVEPAVDGEHHFFVNESPIDGGVTAGRSIDPQRWDGRDANRLVSPGTHRLKVRAWAPTEGWVTAWSDTRVNVSP